MQYVTEYETKEGKTYKKTPSPKPARQQREQETQEKKKEDK